jgi:hypothetical protein
MLIFCIIIFYSAMFVFYGAYGKTKYDLEHQTITYPDGQINGIGTVSTTGSVFGADATLSNKASDQGTGILQFGKYVVTGFSESPLWLNIIFFVPLAGLLAYLLFVAFVPFVDAGQ